MKKIFFICIILISGCDVQCTQSYTIERVNSYDEVKCKYDIVSTSLLGHRFETIIDTIGKFKIGDTVFISLNRRK